MYREKKKNKYTYFSGLVV